MADDKFDWSDHPIVEHSVDAPVADAAQVTANPDQPIDSSFNWDNHAIVTPQQTAAQLAAAKAPPVSMGRAMLVGTGQGASLGWGEEMSSPFVAAAGMMDKTIPTLPNETTWQKYQRLMQTSRDVDREEQKAAQAQHPIAYTAGAVGGGLLAPGLGTEALASGVKNLGLTGVKGVAAKLAAGAGTGAAYGAAIGAGEGEGGITDRLDPALQGAKTGAMFGAAVPAVGEAASQTGEAINDIGGLPVIRDLIDSYRRGKAGQNLVTSAGRKDVSNQMRNASSDLYNDVKGLQSDVGGKIGQNVQNAEESGQKIDLTDDVNNTLSKLRDIQKNGSLKAANYAASVESEIRKILKIPNAQQAEDLSAIAPEGLILPSAESTANQTIEASPQQAQDLKQVLSNYAPKKGMAPQQIEGAGAAKELSGSVSEKLNDITGNNEAQPVTDAEGNTTIAPSLNSQYSGLKDALKLIVGKEGNSLPVQLTTKINNVVSKLDNPNLSGDNADALITDVIKNIRQVNPDIADKYADKLYDFAGAGKIAQQISATGITKGLRGIVTGASNLAGLGAGKIGNTVSSAVNAITPQPVQDFTQAVLKQAPTAPIIGGTEASPAISRIKSQPYQIQRQVANAAESADPDTLKSQAANVRTQYGKTGEQLATTLENMASQDKDGRRALMFSLLQNPAYRKMLGVTPQGEP